MLGLQGGVGSYRFTANFSLEARSRPSRLWWGEKRKCMHTSAHLPPVLLPDQTTLLPCGSKAVAMCKRPDKHARGLDCTIPCSFFLHNFISLLCWCIGYDGSPLHFSLRVYWRRWLCFCLHAAVIFAHQREGVFAGLMMTASQPVPRLFKQLFGSSREFAVLAFKLTFHSSDDVSSGIEGRRLRNSQSYVESCLFQLRWC